eukprot:scaffold4275_cov143-Skeletonema_marinoi.AAC.5
MMPAQNLRGVLDEMMMLKGSDGRDLAVRELGKKSKSDPKKSEKEEGEESTGTGSDDNPCKKPNPCDKGEQCIPGDGNTPKSTRKKSSQCGPCDSDESCKKVDGSYTCVTKSKCHQERTASFHFYPHSSFLPSYPLPNQTPQKLPSLELAVAQTVTVAQTVAQAVAQKTAVVAAAAQAVLTVEVSCAARVRSIAVVVNGDDEDVKSCAKKLRSNVNKNFHPKRIGDFEVVKVGDCSSNKVKNKLKELESNRRSNTNDKVKTVFVVVSKGDFSDDCKRAIRKLPDKIEKDMRCRQIRRMDDDQTDSDDNFIIRVKSESQCTTRKLEKKMLDAADLN